MGPSAHAAVVADYVRHLTLSTLTSLTAELAAQTATNPVREWAVVGRQGPDAHRQVDSLNPPSD